MHERAVLPYNETSRARAGEPGDLVSVVLWQQCIDFLRDELPSQQFNTWIRPLQVDGDQTELRLYAPNRFVLDWVNDKYLNRIQELLDDLSQWDCLPPARPLRGRAGWTYLRQNSRR